MSYRCGTVAIVGRPNVGKSTLFNRLVGRKLALVDDQPGVTRDRREGEARLIDLTFTAVDTAGLEEGDPETLAGRMRAQTETALTDCDAILVMDQGRVLDLGPHRELIARCPTYQTLWHQQNRHMLAAAE